MQVKYFFDGATFTYTYIVFDKETKDAILIDPVLDYDPASGKLDNRNALEVITYIKEQGLKLHASLETHAHADHLSGSQLIKKAFPAAKIAIGKNIKVVQETFKEFFNLDDVVTDGSQFDLLLDEGEMSFGSITVQTIFTPGHTPACASYLIEDNLFTGDALFMPDMGTGRCDFPKGSATDLYHSIHEKLYALPDATKVYVGHDYAPGGREYKCQSTIGEEKEKNIQLPVSKTAEEYISAREGRDAQLAAPKLLLPSIQVNIRAGHLPPAENNGTQYLKLPLGGAKNLGL